MDQLDIATHNTAHNARGGLSRLAQLMGMGEQVLRNKCNPHCNSHKLSLREALAMMIQTGNTEILDVLTHTLRPIKLTEKTPDLVSAVLTSVADHGDVHASIKSALGDGVITLREQNQINQKIAGAIDAMCKLRAAVEVRASEREMRVV